MVGVDVLVHQSHKVQDLLSSPQCRGEVVTGGGAHIVSRGYLHRSLRQLREGFKKEFLKIYGKWTNFDAKKNIF